MPVGKGSLARAAKSTVKKEAAKKPAKAPAESAKRAPAKTAPAEGTKKTPAKAAPAADAKTAAAVTGKAPVKPVLSADGRGNRTAAAVITPESGEKIISRMICDLPVYLL